MADKKYILKFVPTRPLVRQRDRAIDLKFVPTRPLLRFRNPTTTKP